MGSYVRLQQIEHEIGATGRFSLRVTSPEVELRAAPGSIARVTVEFQLQASSDADADAQLERVRYEFASRAGALEVAEPRLGGGGAGSIARLLGSPAGRVDARVVAAIPAGAEVAFNGISADLNATGLIGTQEYRTVSGDLVLHELAGAVRVRGVSSDVSLRADDPLQLEVNTVSGDVSSIAPRYESLRVTTVSGDVELEGELDAATETRLETVSGDVRLGISTGMTLEVRALSSDVSIGLPHRTEGSRDRRRYVVGDGAARVLFSSMSGDLVAGTPRRGRPVPPLAPTPPVAPVAPVPPTPPAPASAPAQAASADDQLAILRALERGEIDVDEATARLARGGGDA